MIGILAFAISIIGVIMSFFNNMRFLAFIFAIASIVVAVISAYYKDKKESGDKAKKDSRALELGAIIIAGATCVSYYVHLIIA